MMKLAIPIVSGRGAGLGNEMMVWGKAFIASQELGLKLLTPAFGMNARKYYRFFRTSRTDWIVNRVLQKALPGAVFSEEDYNKRQPMSFGEAVTDFSKEKGLLEQPVFALGLEGLWGGVEAIAPARDFLRAQLLGARWTVDNLYKMEVTLPRDTLRVGFHIRRGDFASVDRTADFSGKFNQALPVEWYVAVARQLKRALGQKVHFIVVSDADREYLAPFGTEFACSFTDHLDNTDISDLLTLASCDLLVCSVSSYSMWAGFLSEGRYVWFEPNLTYSNGMGSIWGHQEPQRRTSGPTARSALEIAELTKNAGTIAPKGIAAGWDGILPNDLLDWLETRSALKRQSNDLLRYGVVAKVNEPV